jgi:peptidoglycan/LPS O-acetylase OafA/YrhL
MTNRINFLDGMRGLAILLVIGYHAFSRWAELVPYGDTYQEIPFFKMGWLGVQMFFLLSGFVILMTLEKCDNIKVFIYRRWLRLFPAMLICSILVFVSQGLLIERPAGQLSSINLIPGLTFIEPEIVSRIFGQQIVSLEGAFWSLYVEFKFYIFAAIVFYTMGRNFMILSLLSVFAMSVFTGYFVQDIDILLVTFLNKVSVTMSFEYFGWFAAGACFYVYFKERQRNWFILGCFIAICSSFFVGSFDLYTILSALIVSVVFATSFVSQIVQKMLEARIFLFFGFISYPLYLIHENAMIAMVIKLGQLNSSYNGLLYPILPLTILSFVAYLIAKYSEGSVRQLIKKIANHSGRLVRF